MTPAQARAFAWLAFFAGLLVTHLAGAHLVVSIWRRELTQPDPPITPPVPAQPRGPGRVRRGMSGRRGGRMRAAGEQRR
jgi:hypothetical protein